MTQIYNTIRSPAIILVSTLAMGASNYSLNRLASFPPNLIPAKSETKKAYKAVISKKSLAYFIDIYAGYGRYIIILAFVHWYTDRIGALYFIIWVFPKIGVFPLKWMVNIMEKTLFFDGMIWRERYHYFWKRPYMSFPWWRWVIFNLP